jgi:hypothetical protein
MVMDPRMEELFRKLDEEGEDYAYESVANNRFTDRTPWVRFWIDKKNKEKNQKWLEGENEKAAASFALSERATVAAERSAAASEKAAGASEKAALASERSANFTRAAAWASAIAAIVALVLAVLPLLDKERLSIKVGHSKDRWDMNTVPSLSVPMQRTS